MYRPTASPPSSSNPPPPPPTPAGGSGSDAMAAHTSNPRYVYLVTRLRTRRITMEEATELFDLMNALVRDAQARSAVAPSPPSPTLPSPSPAPRPVASVWNDDNLGFALLFLGVGAGLLAAGAKKIRDPPRASGGAPPSR
ncbi:MAG: hypothetical protein ACYCPN_00175 [Thermoplasmata archaeon]